MSRYFLILGIFLFLVSCQTNDNSISNKFNSTIPELLQRSPKIQLEKEWDYVQNTYADQVTSLKKNNKNEIALMNLAELFVKEARVTGEHGHYYPAALQVIDRVLAKPNITKDIEFRALLTKAGVQLSLHEFSEALQTAESAIKINTRNAQIYGVLVDCYVELGEYEKAVKVSDKMISLKPDIRSYSRVSYLRELHEDYDGAIKAMEYAIKAGYPGYEETAWAMLTLAELYKDQGKTTDALAILHEIIEVRKDYPFAIAAIGEIYLAEGKLDKAEEKLKEAIDIIPEVGFNVSLAQLYKIENRQEEFDAIMKEIFFMLEDDVQAGHVMNLEYADIYKELLNQPKEAIKYTLLEYEKRPKNIHVNKLLSELYAETNETDKARKYAESANL